MILENIFSQVSIHRASPVWFLHWLAMHRASPVAIYPIWLYTGLDRTYYSSYFFKFMPTKDLAPFLYIPHKKPSFKPINDHFIVADIC